MRGQISIEYVILIGVILVMTIPLFYYGLSKSREDIRYQQASDALTSIVKTADEVYSLGLGSKDFVWVNTPTGLTGVDVQGKTLVINVSIFGGTSEFTASSRVNLTVTQNFIERIVLPGRYKVPVEAYWNVSTNTVMVLLGGSCGDNICSGTENAGTCASDCASSCGDGVCDYPDTESCLGTGGTTICSDCIGSIVDCADGEICQDDLNNPGTLICVAGGFCGDGICAYPYTEHCNNCRDDCLPEGWTCCEDPILDTWYPDNTVPLCDIPPSVTDCGDYCKWLSFSYGLFYDNGVCRQTEAQCGVNSEVYVGDIADTLGVSSIEDEGNSYCPGSALLDKCCCIPS